MSKAPTTKIAKVAGHSGWQKEHHKLESHRTVSSHQARRHHLYLKAAKAGTSSPPCAMNQTGRGTRSID
jgi:hypothetical protein